jgi:VanZ family protein
LHFEPCILNYRLVQLWGPVALYMAAIFYLSSLHQAPLPPGVSDKPAHSFGYLGLGLVIARALARGLPPRVTLRQALIGIALASLYGITDEFHQRFVAGRSADMADWYADSLGAAIALFGCWAWGILAPVGGQPAAGSRQE